MMIDRIVKIKLNQVRAWLTKVGSEVLEEGRTKLEFAFLERTPESTRLLPLFLDKLALYFGRRGILEIYDGNAEGRSLLNLSVYHHYCSLAVRFDLFKRLADEPDLAYDSGRAGSTLCYGACYNIASVAGVLTDILAGDATIESLFGSEGLHAKHFELFCLALSSFFTLADVRQGNEIYSLELFGGDQSAFTNAVYQICEYRRLRLSDDYEDKTFGESPFDLIPWEVLALLAIRRRHGLVTPAIEHPVLWPLGRLEGWKPKWPPNQLQKRLDEHWRTVFGNAVAM